MDYYNNHRPSYAIGYDIPSNYRERYYKGELDKKDTFKDRILDTVPKFVRKSQEKAKNNGLSTNEGKEK